MRTIVETVEDWYTEGRSKAIGIPGDLYVHSYKPDDAADGKIEIRYENSRTLASITLWNRGFIMVITLDKITGKDQSLEDRALSSEDNVCSLLDRYWREIVSSL